MALTIEEANKLKVGQKLSYLAGAYDVEYVRHSLNRTDGPGAGYVEVTAVHAQILHMDLSVGNVVLAVPSELAWP
jgi:hypothetical protein